MTQRVGSQILKKLKQGAVKGPEGKLPRLFELTGCNRTTLRGVLDELARAKKIKVVRNAENNYVEISRVTN